MPAAFDFIKGLFRTGRKAVALSCVSPKSERRDAKSSRQDAFARQTERVVAIRMFEGDRIVGALELSPHDARRLARRILSAAEEDEGLGQYRWIFTSGNSLRRVPVGVVHLNE